MKVSGLPRPVSISDDTLFLVTTSPSTSPESAAVTADVVTAHVAADLALDGSQITTGVVADARIASTIARDSEVTAAVAAHVDDTSAAHAASAIAFTPTGTITATTVQAAIAEVASEAGSGGAGATGATGAGGSVGGQGATGATGAAGSGVTIKGTDTWANISALPTPTAGDMWLLSAPDAGAPLFGGNPAAAGDGLVWSGAAWTNVGPIRGPEGAQGDPGATGATGAQGDPGATGGAGPAGATGATGATGGAGGQGATGATGPQGVPGNDGAEGDPGPAGATGATGASGGAGGQGATGATGAGGAGGATGATGANGDWSSAQAVNAQTGTSYTLVLADAGKIVTLANTEEITLTIPPNSSVAMAVGVSITFATLDFGQVTVSPGSGVTVNARGAANKSAGRYAMWTATKVATDSWIISGDLTA